MNYEKAVCRNAMLVLALLVFLPLKSNAQYLSRGDSALIGKRAYIREPHIKGTTLFQFVDSSGKVIKQIELGKNKAQPLLWKLNAKASDNQCSDEFYWSLINDTKDRLGIFKIKTYLKDKAFYTKTLFCGIDKVDNIVYDEKGNVVFQKKGVPYQLVKIADHGTGYCCFVPFIENEYDYDNDSGVLPTMTTREIDSSLQKDKGKIYVLNSLGDIIFEDGYSASFSNQDYHMAFSPNGEWFAYLENPSGGGKLFNMIDKKVYPIKEHIDIKSMRLFNGYYAPFSKVSNDGKLMIRKSNNNEDRILYYDVQNDVFELRENGSWIWGREDIQQ